MKQNMQPSENNPEIKLDSEGESINSSPKKNLSNKTVALVLIFVVLIIAGIVYFMFYSEENNNQATPIENMGVVENKKAEIDKNLDTDQDKLPDYLEKILGTALDNPDTDGDSYSDFDEIKNGYSPLTAEKFMEEEWEEVKERIKRENEGLFGEMFGGVVSNSDFTCGTTTVSDIDGNIYNTVKIGEQCWMKENLKVTKNPAGEMITRYCYDNDPAICETDGGLYDWNTAMNGSTTEGAQGICPTGWHVPKDGEFKILVESQATAGCESSIQWQCDLSGTKLKVGGISGFNGVLAGELYAYVTLERNTFAYFWSSSEDAGGRDAWIRSLGSEYSTVGRGTHVIKTGLSVRCLKD